MLLTVAVTLAVAWLSWRLLERPLVRWGQSFTYAPAAEAGPPPERTRPAEAFPAVGRPLRAAP
jgi:peptidoglycan/LPS O-acetylase OafA/YrhL